jgi:hypothetical protein
LYCHLQSRAWPRAYAGGKNLCAGSKTHNPTGSASEQISAAPVVAKFVADVIVPAGICKRECKSMLLLCDVMNMLSIANSGLVSAHSLGVGIVSHLKAHQAAYDLTLWGPKSHWCLHMPFQL